MPSSSLDSLFLAPELWLTLAGLVLLIVATVKGPGSERVVATLSTGALVVTGVLVALLPSWAGSLPRSAFSGMLVVDRFGLWFQLLVVGAAIVTVLFSLRFVGTSPYPGGEYHALILFTTVGMLFMASGTHLATLYIGLETMALAQYVLAGYFKRETKSIEAGAKYFVLGAFSSGVLLYGISLVYGATGRLDLAGIAQAIGRGERTPLLVVGILLTACGLFFKIASAPFHVWAPDVYEGAPTPISAFFAVGPKLAAYAVFARVFFSGFGPASHDWATVIAASSALTMVVGNVGALMQTNVKRMLGYSSIGHAGYALMGLLAYGPVTDVGVSRSPHAPQAGNYGLWAILIYLLAYALMNLGAFGLVILLESKGYACESVEDFNGLARKNPLAAAAMVVFLLSLAGIPPTAGFIGKYFLFAAAMQAGWFWLALLAVLMSAVSLFYYFRIVRAMYMVEGEGELRWREAPAVSVAVALCAAGTLLVGVAPQPFLALARAAAVLR